MAEICSKELIFGMIKGALAEFGLTPKNDNVYYRNIGEGIYGVVNLGITTMGAAERMILAPSVGILHEETERMMGDVANLNTLDQFMPTINVPLAELIPNREDAQWELCRGQDNEAILRKMFEDLGQFGMAFFDRNNTTEAIIENMEEGRYIAQNARIYKLPLIYFCNNQKEKGVEFVTQNQNPNDFMYDQFCNRYRTL